jgi:hypothetical protein
MMMMMVFRGPRGSATYHDFSEGAIPEDVVNLDCLFFVCRRRWWYHLSGDVAAAVETEVKMLRTRRTWRRLRRVRRDHRDCADAVRICNCMSYSDYRPALAANSTSTRTGGQDGAYASCVELVLSQKGEDVYLQRVTPVTLNRGLKAMVAPWFRRSALFLGSPSATKSTTPLPLLYGTPPSSGPHQHQHLPSPTRTNTSRNPWDHTITLK